MLEQLEEIGIEPSASEFELQQGTLWEALDVLAPLTDKGWTLRGRDNRRLMAGKAKGLRVSSGQDWFDVEGGIEFGDAIVPLPKAIRAFLCGEQAIELEGGGLGVLPQEWLEKHARGLSMGLADSGRGKDTRLRFHAAHAMLLDELLDAAETKALPEKQESVIRCDMPPGRSSPTSAVKFHVLSDVPCRRCRWQHERPASPGFPAACSMTRSALTARPCTCCRESRRLREGRRLQLGLKELLRNRERLGLLLVHQFAPLPIIIHFQVLEACGPCLVLLGKQGPKQTKRRRLIGKSAQYLFAPPDLFVETLHHVRGPQPSVVFHWQRLRRDGVFQPIFQLVQRIVCLALERLLPRWAAGCATDAAFVDMGSGLQHISISSSRSISGLRAEWSVHDCIIR